MTRKQIATVLREYDRRETVELPQDKAVFFAEDVLAPLGYDVTAMDASDYEGASLIHDLNKPIGDDLIESYDIVFDGGTLEHIFEFTTALHSAMSMVKVGGHLLCMTAANNQCGHGFYQFSPELFFRVFSAENGYVLRRLYLTCGNRLFHVVDPIDVHQRVELLNGEATGVMVDAEKIAPTPTKLVVPQQSDYVAAWSPGPAEDGRIKAFLRKALSPSQITRISRVLNNLRQRNVARRWKQNSRLSNRRFYIPVTDWSLTTHEATRKRM